MDEVKKAREERAERLMSQQGDTTLICSECGYHCEGDWCSCCNDDILVDAPEPLDLDDVDPLPLDDSDSDHTCRTCWDTGMVGVDVACPCCQSGECAGN